MKTRRYSEAQVFRILKEVESGMPVVDGAVYGTDLVAPP